MKIARVTVTMRAKTTNVITNLTMRKVRSLRHIEIRLRKLPKLREDLVQRDLIPSKSAET